MSAKNNFNFVLMGGLSVLWGAATACTRKTTREVIGQPPVAIETTTPSSSAPLQPEFSEEQGAPPPFDGGRPEMIVVPADARQPVGRFADVYSELLGLEPDSCQEVTP